MEISLYSPFSFLFRYFILFARPMASRWRFRLRMTEPQDRAPARAPPNPHVNKSWPIKTTSLKPDWDKCSTGVLFKDGLTCQVEVLQWSLRSHQSGELGVKASHAVIYAVHLTFGGCDIVHVCERRSGVDVLDLQQKRKTRTCMLTTRNSQL